MKILTIEKKEEEKFLRKKTAEFDFSKFSKKEINELVKEMKKIMIEKDGVGLAANQAGFDFSMFVAESPASGATRKRFYAVFNPQIEKVSKETKKDIEGCLSVPEVMGEVERYKIITVSGQDQNGKKTKLKVFGYTARIFQHEIDHLNGILFIDRASKKFKVTGEKVMKG
jgi:peptide deformylase